MIQIAFHRTVKLAWKREFGFLSLNTTVYGSGASTDATLLARTALNRIPGFLIWVITVEITSSAVNSMPSLQKMPLRNFAVISVKSALYCGLSAASELSQTPSRPLSGSMYQSVSSAACCRPLDCEPALIAQILNQPAFLMVPSGFSRISSSFLGIFCGMPCASELVDSCGIKAHTASSNA